MRTHIKDIDHCCVLVRDFASARATFQRLGFTVAPFGRHGAEMGTANHTVMLEQSYLELLGVVTPTDFNREIRDVLTVREGIAAIALGTCDAEAAVAELTAAGVATRGPQSVRRPVALPDGSEAEAAFTIAHFPDVGTPFMQVFCNQILTPEYVRHPQLTRHPNTAWGIDTVAIVTPTPDTEAATVARCLDTAPHRGTHDTIEVATGGAPLTYLTAEAVAARYPGADLSGLAQSGPAVLALTVRDAQAAQACLARSGVPFTATGDSLVVAPRYACGVLLVLREVRPAH
ncbi:VOC family protein [Streptomyces cylindrosporus]|uniref:VOC family protein n=1 Tax=Streptomyces cylindrosporus TaxID=2927583 RepID=A0ABS9Y864_9ACTN|nr:VOC family protein [Streptomyces cylindrosporus]MCI3273418.1 VOC family protein [Streptomyces cylindrosporus]